MASKKHDVVVVGGGPSGLAAAHALAKVLPAGSSIGLYEKAPSVSTPRGAGLGMEVNGLRALQAIDKDVYDAIIKKHAVNSSTSDIKDPKGNVLKTHDLDAARDITHAKYGMHAVQMGWHELVTTMAEMLPPNVEVHGGAKLLHYEEVEGEEPGVRVFFEGEEPVTARLLVAADGYFSRTRQQLLADGPPTYGDSLFWRARVEVEQAEKYGFRKGKVAYYFGEHRVLLVFTIGPGHIVWTACCADSELKAVGIDWQAVTAGRQEAGAQSSDYLQKNKEHGLQAKERLLRTFAGWDPAVVDLMRDTAPETIVEHAVYFRPACDMTPEWFGKGRVVLLGDAAHPMRPTGQGANQALEDAYQLGRFIQEDGGGFGKLEEFRHQRAARVQPIASHAEAQGKAAYKKDAAVDRINLTDRSAGLRNAVAAASPAAGSTDGKPAPALLDNFEELVFGRADFPPLQRVQERVEAVAGVC